MSKCLKKSLEDTEICFVIILSLCVQCMSDNFRNVALWNVGYVFVISPWRQPPLSSKALSPVQESGKHCTRNERNFVLLSVSPFSSLRFRSSAWPGPLRFSFCFFERWPTITTSHKQWSWLSWWRWGGWSVFAFGSCCTGRLSAESL